MTRSPAPLLPAGPRRPRPGGRSARVVGSVLGTAFELLAQGGLPALVVAEVAQRAGVHPTSIYRRWPTREALAVAACLAQADAAIRLPDTGSWRGDVLALAAAAAAFVESPAGRVLLALGVAGAGTAGDARPDYWRSRMDALAPVFDRAVARGEVADRGHARRCLEAAIAPLYLQALVSGEPVSAWPWRAHVEALLGQTAWVAALRHG